MDSDDFRSKSYPKSQQGKNKEIDIPTLVENEK
jgi:hypothetical protein